MSKQTPMYENVTVFVEFTEAEKKARKERIGELHIERRALEKDKSEALEACRAKLKPLLKEVDELSREVEVGGYEAERELLVEMDYAKAECPYLDKAGNVVRSRTLDPEELQSSFDDAAASANA